jgi:hypothetical protein
MAATLSDVFFHCRTISCLGEFGRTVIRLSKPVLRGEALIFMANTV